ncbi:serine acetyltransferase [Paraburkholderia sp. WSM4179]|nr:serine acetyltransferase [Paraburkholderia sp. WSM4179]
MITIGSGPRVGANSVIVENSPPDLTGGRNLD